MLPSLFRTTDLTRNCLFISLCLSFAISTQTVYAQSEVPEEELDSIEVYQRANISGLWTDSEGWYRYISADLRLYVCAPTTTENLFVCDDLGNTIEYRDDGFFAVLDTPVRYSVHPHESARATYSSFHGRLKSELTRVTEAQIAFLTEGYGIE